MDELIFISSFLFIIYFSDELVSDFFSDELNETVHLLNVPALDFTRYKITEELSKGNVKLIPDVLIGGNGNNNGSAMDGLLGLKLMELMDPDKRKEGGAVAEIIETKPEPKKDNINP